MSSSVLSTENTLTFGLEEGEDVMVNIPIKRFFAFASLFLLQKKSPIYCDEAKRTDVLPFWVLLTHDTRPTIEAFTCFCVSLGRDTVVFECDGSLFPGSCQKGNR